MSFRISLNRSVVLKVGSGDPGGGPRQFVIIHGFHALFAIKHIKVKPLSGDQMVYKI